MKTLKVLLQEVVSGIKAWVNSNFAQESNTVHKTGNETVNGNKTFSGRNTFSDHTYIYGQWKGLYFKNPEATAGTAPSGDKRSYISFTDSNDYVLGSIVLNVTGANSTWLQTGVSAKDVNDSSQSIYCGTQYRVYGNGEKYFVPATNGDVHLGTSTLKWKTLNGVNPGALSLPNYSDTTYIDISGSIVPPSGQTTINYSGGENQYTPPVDGWLSIRCDGATFLQVYRNSYNCPGVTSSRQTSAGRLVVTLPVLKNNKYTIIIYTSGTTNVFQLYPCLGNV